MSIVEAKKDQSFLARGNAPKPFHLTEEIFDEMTPCVFVLVMRGMPVGSLAKRDDSLNVTPAKRLRNQRASNALSPMRARQ